ncbi:hypothetical protein HYH03_001088 [Edaphochlamys debaryana]|uniref:EGF-like domain-containing protein n=1 Tax=Edaphochlamys debaryana TaxID=47281 RepID=A0A835YEX6_9CHLO|nr:hypothetical protein HYH03_001088 [Edaphochlamys debaryana]|eukprot:KAG2501286.1 hypothetical protein HYH03_001088 [Edaphochlamys debaryana]
MEERRPRRLGSCSGARLLPQLALGLPLLLLLALAANPRPGRAVTQPLGEPFPAVITSDAHGQSPPVLYGNRTAGWYAIGLLPPNISPLQLVPDTFGTALDPWGLPRLCDERQSTSAIVSGFGLPGPDLEEWTLAAVMDPPRRDLGAATSVGPLLEIGGVQIQWDVGGSGRILLHAPWDPAATLVFDASRGGGAVPPWPVTVLSVARRRDGALAVCLNGVAPRTLQLPLGVSLLEGGSGWYSPGSLSSRWSLAVTDARTGFNSTASVQIGDYTDDNSPSTRLHQVWLASAAWGCPQAGQMLWYGRNSIPPPPPSYTIVRQDPAPLGVPTFLAVQQYDNSPPSLKQFSLAVTAADGRPGGTGAVGEAFVTETVTVTAVVTDADGDGLRLRLTAYGVPPPGCATSGCGDDGFSVYSGSGMATLSYSVAYPLPGRYVMRLEASDLLGPVWAWDLAVLVRKAGDTGRQAPCCRTSGMLISGQQGRPLHATRFRDGDVASLALGLGWAPEYVAGPEELEAERLFDFGGLAPAHRPGGLTRSACPDGLLAGPGSPRVLGGSAAQRAVTSGHGKRILVVPQGFPWGASPPNASDPPSCESHWSRWAAQSPYRKQNGQLPDGSPSYCSYACTRGGWAQLQERAAVGSRVGEVMAELSYGRLGLAPGFTVTDTLPMPLPSASPSLAVGGAFAYSDAPLGPFLRAQGVDRGAFHSVVVLSPGPPKSINNGFTAWSSVGAGSLFVMRCAPQTYYLVHELGHLLGLPHGGIWRLDDGTSAPADPSGPGGPVDEYSDKLDMMACCRGDYAALARLWLGWLPSPERLHVPISEIADFGPRSPPPPPPSPSPPTTSQPTPTAGTNPTAACSPSAAPDGCSYTLWPLDRAESRGRLKALTIRLAEDRLLVLSYKSLAWWQDARLGRAGPDSQPDRPDRGVLTADEMRGPLAGLSVEYMRLVADSSGRRTWTPRGLLNFNNLFGEWPSALPPTRGSMPPDPAKAAVALLKPGQSWLQREAGLLVVAQGVTECDGQTEVPLYNYTAPNFYGFRGEAPGTEYFRRADFSGFAALRCLRVALRTRVGKRGESAAAAAAAKSGVLPVDVSVAGAPTGGAAPLDLRGSCGFPLMPRLRISLPELVSTTETQTSEEPTTKDDGGRVDGGAGAGGEENAGGLPDRVAAVVWLDPSNVTFAYDTMEAVLPPYSDAWIREASAQDSPACSYGCDASYRIRVAMYDGRQTLISVRISHVSLASYVLQLSYRYYTPDTIRTEIKILYVPIARPWAPSAAPPPSSPPPSPSPSPPPSPPRGGGGGTAVAKAAAGSASPPPSPPPSPSNKHPTAGAWGLQLAGDTAGPLPLEQQPGPVWAAAQLPPTGCSGQWSLTLVVKLRGASLPEGRWPLATAFLDLPPLPSSTSSTASTSAPLPGRPLSLLLARAPSAPAPPTDDGTFAGASTALEGRTWGLALVVALGPNLEAAVPIPASRDEQVRHVVVVYDNGRLGAWVDGAGGLHFWDASCAPPRPGVLHCAGPGGPAAATYSAASAAADPRGGARTKAAALMGVSLGGAASSLDAALLSARLYNYALPRADFAAESTCLGPSLGAGVGPAGPGAGASGPGSCAALFGLRLALTDPAPAPAPAADGSGSGLDGLVAAGPGPTAVALTAVQAAAWDVVAAAGAAAAPMDVKIPPPPSYSIKVGDWSGCSAPCGGGVRVRAVTCWRAAQPGPWPVALSDCPLAAAAAAPPLAEPCNLQPCGRAVAVLAVLPGPERCTGSGSGSGLGVQACGGDPVAAAVRQQPGLQGRGLLSPVCLGAGSGPGLQLPLEACAAPDRGDGSPKLSTAASSPAASEFATLGANDTVSWSSVPLVANATVAAGVAGGSVLLRSLLLRDSSIPAGSSLQAASDAGDLLPACPSAAAATAAATATANTSGSSSAGCATFEWRYSPWTTCRAACAVGPAAGGAGTGIRTRTPRCVYAASGGPASWEACSSALGPPPPTARVATCVDAGPCEPAVWKVGEWSECGLTYGTRLGYGTRRRRVDCVKATDPDGPAVDDFNCRRLPDDALAAALVGLGVTGGGFGAAVERHGEGVGSEGWKPADTVACSVPLPLGSALCMVPWVTPSQQPCFGRGTCTYAGCVCGDGYGGPFCEAAMAPSPPASPASSHTSTSTSTPASTATPAPATTGGGCASALYDTAGTCCPSGVLDVAGTCCGAPADPSAPLGLDAAGACCAAPLDACGVCGGSGAAVDVQGACCPTRLDRYGLCCASGLVDECGLCDGDGTSCALRLSIALTVAPGTTPWWSPAPSSSNPSSSALSDAGSSAAQPVLVQITDAAVTAVSSMVRTALGPAEDRLGVTLSSATAVIVTLSAVNANGAGAVGVSTGWTKLVLSYDVRYGAPSGVADAWYGTNFGGSGLLAPYNFSTTIVAMRMAALSDFAWPAAPALAAVAGAPPPGGSSSPSRAAWVELGVLKPLDELADQDAAVLAAMQAAFDGTGGGATSAAQQSLTAQLHQAADPNSASSGRLGGSSSSSSKTALQPSEQDPQTAELDSSARADEQSYVRTETNAVLPYAEDTQPIDVGGGFVLREVAAGAPDSLSTHTALDSLNTPHRETLEAAQRLLGGPGQQAALRDEARSAAADVGLVTARARDLGLAGPAAGLAAAATDGADGNAWAAAGPAGAQGAERIHARKMQQAGELGLRQRRRRSLAEAHSTTSTTHHSAAYVTTAPSAAAAATLASSDPTATRRRRNLLQKPAKTQQPSAAVSSPPPSPRPPSPRPSPPAPLPPRPAPRPPAPVPTPAQLERAATLEALRIFETFHLNRANLGIAAGSLLGVSRAGVCGNGLCEVGEVAAPPADETTAANQGAAWSGWSQQQVCPADCPLPLRSCPAGSPAGGAGPWVGAEEVALLPCSGRGACLAGSGACVCFTGYTGDACDQCAPGFRRSLPLRPGASAAGTSSSSSPSSEGAWAVCVPHLVLGRSLAAWDAEGYDRSDGLTRMQIIIIVIIACSSVLAIAALAGAVRWYRLAKASTVVVPSPSPGKTKSRSSQVVPFDPARTPSRASASPRTPPSPKRPKPGHSPRRLPRSRTATDGGAEAKAGPEAVVVAATGAEVAASTPQRRALLRVTATGEDVMADGLQVVPHTGLTPSQPHRARAAHHTAHHAAHPTAETPTSASLRARILAWAWAAPSPSTPPEARRAPPPSRAPSAAAPAPVRSQAPSPREQEHMHGRVYPPGHRERQAQMRDADGARGIAGAAVAEGALRAQSRRGAVAESLAPGLLTPRSPRLPVSPGPPPSSAAATPSRRGLFGMPLLSWLVPSAAPPQPGWASGGSGGRGGGSLGQAAHPHADSGAEDGALMTVGGGAEALRSPLSPPPSAGGMRARRGLGLARRADATAAAAAAAGVAAAEAASPGVPLLPPGTPLSARAGPGGRDRSLFAAVTPSPARRRRATSAAAAAAAPTPESTCSAPTWNSAAAAAAALPPSPSPDQGLFGSGGGVAPASPSAVGYAASPTLPQRRRLALAAAGGGGGGGASLGSRCSQLSRWWSPATGASSGGGGGGSGGGGAGLTARALPALATADEAEGEDAEAVADVTPPVSPLRLTFDHVAADGPNEAPTADGGGGDCADVSSGLVMAAPAMTSQASAAAAGSSAGSSGSGPAGAGGRRTNSTGSGPGSGAGGGGGGGTVPPMAVAGVGSRGRSRSTSGSGGGSATAGEGAGGGEAGGRRAQPRRPWAR